MITVAVLFLLHWGYVHFGVAGTGPYYGFWSGFGSDLGYVAVVGGLVAIYRRHNCEVTRCWRIGRHDTAAGHTVCRKHHPDARLTAQNVLDAHEEALDGR